MVAKPSGALEITPQGTRFIPFITPKAVGLAFAAGMAVGAIIAGLSATKRVRIVKSAEPSRS